MTNRLAIILRLTFSPFLSPSSVRRIIEPLASRCSKFRFRTLDNTSTQDRLQHIATTEGVAFEDGVLDTLIKTSDGDLRRAITYLQSAARLHKSTALGAVDGGKEGAAPKSSKVSPQSIVEIAGVVPPSVIISLGNAVGVDPPPGTDANDDAIMGSSSTAKKASFDAVHSSVKKIVSLGYSASQLLVQLHDYIIEHPSLEARKKAKCALAMGEADKGLVDGGDEELQLLSLCLKLTRALA